MRISDWSSDVCSSDLRRVDLHEVAGLDRTRCNYAGDRRDHLGIGQFQVGEVVHRARVGQVVLELVEVVGAHHLLRSEEHTSELQSLMRISYAVFCLKKKTTARHNSKETRHR